MNVLVTGGAGFIGSNLAEELSKNHDVKILDNLSTGKIENISELLNKNNVEFIEGSITDLNLVKESLSGVDWVFHQAALASVPRSVKNPEKTNQANIDGTLNVLTAARDLGVNKVVFASSSSVYGGGEDLPKKENMRARTLSPYAASKLSGEKYCEAFHEVYGLDTVSLRYFNVFGPKQDPGSEYAAVIPKFIKRLSNDQPPVIYGDGQQTRDFTYIDNVVRANILAAKKDELGVFNVGCGERFSIDELARSLAEIMSKDIDPVYTEPREGDVRHSLADITKIEENLGYAPDVGFYEGLEQTVEWYNEAYR
ncbi:SDR family oxidoreductase [Methanonatronarchaeum sp. AMET-Sl]|uniref:SDR family oxidoreductase n=1 Tax=Methanonatronarchaeum sp. AMET-Sl TaxID=3037654 RepID=UPI00244D9F27|nr:SDR family oxidoreductase [Methanonatronarchaeum sp. AMET-Sl]WGI17652.1 SDR family oxidoreductase [Methanonatronarchaeum sp. AMET-Sl]